jgi:3-deoxy-manno-octulosonate cytidylyltransferase (CMP-KDO synthetase)
MKIIAVIPARYAATRFPAKLMQMLGNKTVIRHTYENTVATGLFDDVLVATDHELIFNELSSHNGKVVMTRPDHESGSDRIAEAVKDLDVDVIINVQGDEPFMARQPLEDLISAFRDPLVRVASLMHTIKDESQIDNPNIVKVVTDRAGFSLYFSRSRIPFNRNNESDFTYNRHIGVYGYRKSALLEFVEWPVSPLEQMEKLEQLRYLENGVRLKMVATDFFSIGIDTPEDYLLAKRHLNEGK